MKSVQVEAWVSVASAASKAFAGRVDAVTMQRIRRWAFAGLIEYRRAGDRGWMEVSLESLFTFLEQNGYRKS